MPAFLDLLNSEELDRRAALACERLAHCDLCPRDCGVDRKAGKLGVCRTGENAKVSSYGQHMGEEHPLRGWLGSGTIFFTRCNLRCQYCQNHEISQTDAYEK
jgi:putative pyruvate formate lyase activating enzyme